MTFRHDILVETEAELLREAKCGNVYTEPALLPTREQLHPKGTITADGARLDVVAIGLYGKMRGPSWMYVSRAQTLPLTC